MRVSNSALLAAVVVVVLVSFVDCERRVSARRVRNPHTEYTHNTHSN